MSKLHEGRFEFDFTEAATAEKLDTPGIPLPQGMSFVDFVVEEKSRMLLVEVKDPEGAPPKHRTKAMDDFGGRIQSGDLINHEIVPKARDSYTFLHLMKRDHKDFILIAFLGVGNPDKALLLDFKNRLLGRLRKETASAWVRNYVKDCVVVTPGTWNDVFPEYPISKLRD